MRVTSEEILAAVDTDGWDIFQIGYISCALWSSVDDSGEPLDRAEIPIADDSVKAMREDCQDFLTADVLALIDAAGENYSYESAGHDFWLTRNGHGAGFWDRGLGEIGTKLTDAAKAHGSCDLYIGDDQQIHSA